MRWVLCLLLVIFIYMTSTVWAEPEVGDIYTRGEEKYTVMFVSSDKTTIRLELCKELKVNFTEEYFKWKLERERGR